MAYTYSQPISTVTESTPVSTPSTSSTTSTNITNDGYANEKTPASVGHSLTDTKRYSDLNLQMIVHPQKQDIIPLLGEQAVKNAIRTLLLTNFMERPFQPNLGANLRSLLFEPNDAITRLALKDAIFNVLSLHEPRIENINVIIESTTNENAYRVTIIFSIKENDSIQEVEINLRRLR